MRSRLISAVFFLLTFSVSTLVAETVLDISGQVRVRNSAIRSGYEPESGFWYENLLRVRLNAKAKINSDVSAFVQLQDSRDFMRDSAQQNGSGTTLNSQNTDLHQGHIVLRRFPLRGSELKIGRFEFSHGDGRLFGPDDWDNVGRSFNGASLTYGDSLNFVRAFGLAGPSHRQDHIDYLQTIIWGISGKVDVVGLEPIAYYENIDEMQFYDEISTDRFTVGVFGKQQSTSLEIQWNVAGQAGTWEYVPSGYGTIGFSRNIEAWMIAASTSWRIPWSPKLSITVGLDLASGDGSWNDSTDAIFQAPYQSLHDFHGGQLFLGNEGHFYEPYMIRGGMRELYAGFEYSADSRFSLSLLGHAFKTARYFFEGNWHLGQPSYRRSQKIGTQFTTKIATRLYSAVEWQLVGALLFPTEEYAMDYDPEPGCYLYTQMTVDF